MMLSFFPLKKLRRNIKYLLFGAVLMIGVLAAYLEFVAPANTWNDGVQLSAWDASTASTSRATVRESLSSEEGRSWQSQFTPQSWRPEYKGKANLHIFEDWCGSSTLHLRKNLHFPLFPHTRTTVKKLAVSPRWTNYGLRIFGYLHPYVDGKYLFAVASDDNSEFWLSSDNSPQNLRELALVGKTGSEWTAPGEFGKYASQTSQPVQLMAGKRYYFEILHKQDDKGTDHVEVAWRLQDGQRFTVIDSNYISLYTNESALRMSEVTHIPQSEASHAAPPRGTGGAPTSGDPNLGADMLREDPRDSQHRIPLVDELHARHILPMCSYSPSYIIKGFPLARYQGLQFVHMSYIYPNDYTRLTHMEAENKCFYHENPYYLDSFGFFRYMKMDFPENGGFEDKERILDQQVPDAGLQESILIDELFHDENPATKDPRLEKSEEKTTERSNDLQDYGDDYDDYALKRKRKLFSVSLATAPKNRKRKRRVKARPPEPRAGRSDLAQEAEPLSKVGNGEKNRGRDAQYGRSKPSQLHPGYQEKNDSGMLLAKKARRMGAALLPGITAGQSEHQLGPSTPMARPDRLSRNRAHAPQPIATQAEPPRQQLKVTTSGNGLTLRSSVTSPPSRIETATAERLARRGRWRIGLRGNEEDERAEPQLDRQLDVALDPGADRSVQRGGEEAWPDARGANETEAEDMRRFWGESEAALGLTHPPAFDQVVNWQQTFDVAPLDFHSLRSDWIDLSCNVSGNLLLDAEEAAGVVDGFMRKLHLRSPGRFSLERVLNVEKRADGSQGSRYLLELQLQEEGRGRVRLSQYIYALQRRRGPRGRRGAPRHDLPQREPLLCAPLGFSWDPQATVHFLVPVKNQARWVQQFIADMEWLYKETGDRNFNIIITDYSSTDMDVEEALRTSSLPSYQYLKLKGNFERSAGLQAGIGLINDDHSIVFLCDLHIHFPPFIIESVRKHCVEGKMAFAPILMRLNCGATPSDATGFWEVNGFGLLGIYKSDLDAAGGMNTRDFRDRWGGEDWELLDRILQSGLEVERIHLRNFMHHFHSKRGMWNRVPRKST